MIVALLCGGGAHGAEPPRVGGCPVLPAFTGSATAASAASLRAFNQDVSRSPVDPRSPAYISRIESLGGSFEIDSAFGEGTLLIATVPYVPASAEPTCAPPLAVGP